MRLPQTKQSARIVGANTKANTIGRETAIIAPLFKKFTAERDAMHSTNLFVVADADYARDLKAKFLADAIPAESFAAGANALLVWGESRNYNFQSETPSGWPKLDDDDNPVWEHSDLKNVAYFYVYKLFKRLVRDSNQGE